MDKFRRVVDMLLKLNDRALHTIFSDPEYLARTLNEVCLATTTRNPDTAS